MTQNSPSRSSLTKESQRPIGQLLALENGIRSQNTKQDLVDHLSNAFSQYLKAEQAVSLVWKRGTASIISGSNVPDVNNESDWLQSLEHQVSEFSRGKQTQASRISLSSSNDVPTAHPFGLYLPLESKAKKTPDAVIFARSRPWKDAEITEAQYITGVYNHAFRRAESQYSRWSRIFWRFLLLLIFIAVMLALIFVRIPAITTAPARIIPQNPHVVAVQVSGIVESINVTDGQFVSKGTVLAKLQSDTARVAFSTAQQELLVAQARATQLRTSALRQADARQELNVAEAEVSLAEIAITEAELELARHKLTAPVEGKIYADQLKNLPGQPVNFGDVLMQVVSEGQVQILANVSVQDSSFIYDLKGARLFLNDAPLEPIEVHKAGRPYQPQEDSRGAVSYDLLLDFKDPQNLPALGAEGVVQLTGEKAPLGYVLFRRPIIWLISKLPYSVWSLLYSSEK